VFWWKWGDGAVALDGKLRKIRNCGLARKVAYQAPVSSGRLQSQFAMGGVTSCLRTSLSLTM
jgi:hypothetical protein